MADQPDDGFSSEERRALDAWVAPAAPAGFADRVLARAESKPRSTSPLFTWLAAAAVLAVGIPATLWLTNRQARSSGSSVAQTRTTLELGRRAVAVAEPQASVRWEIDASGEGTVTQDRGNIFYRVEPGRAFTVQTPAGTARVMGTCFRVEVVDMNASSLKGAAVGAALSALAVVTVYEGRVTAETGAQELPIAAGEAAVMEGSTARHVPSGSTASSPEVVAQAARGSSSAGSDFAKMDPSSPGAVAMADRLVLQREASGLRDRVKELEAALKEAKGKTNSERTYDLPQEDLQSMADQCELRWDYMGGDATRAPTVSDDDAKKVGFTPDQQQALDALLATHNQQMVGQIRSLYTEMTHDPGAGSMAVQSMIDEAYDKTAPLERQTAFQNLARERAGLQPPPGDVGQTRPFERLYRMFQGSGDSLEQQMGKIVGPQQARAYRDLHGGYGSKHRSSSGCPKGP